MARVSEYQYYEFLALDRPLTTLERSQLRALSTRAEITATRFTNEYERGDFKGNPAEMMEQHFDAHLYFANRGTRRLMLRVPRAALDAGTARQYLYADTAASLTETADHLIIDLYADRDPDDCWEDPPGLGSMTEARSALIAGDVRLLYLAWLLAVQCGEIDDDDAEPPVPAGLADLSEALEEIVDFLEIEEDLIDVAVDASPDADPDPGEDDLDEIGDWIAALPALEKDKLLTRVASGEGGQVQALLLRRFRDSRPDQGGTGQGGTGQGEGASRRTARELLDAAEDYRTEIAKAVQEHRRVTNC